MSTAVLPGTCPNYIWECKEVEQAKGEPLHTPYEPFLNTTHSTLQVCHPLGSLQPDNETIPVTVYDGGNGTKVPLDLKSTDTIGKLKEAYVKKKPHMSGSLNLIYNGRPVLSERTLGDLGVKANATFLTYQRCIGG